MPGIPANVPVASMTPEQVPGEQEISVRKPAMVSVVTLVPQLDVVGSWVQDTTVVTWYSVNGTMEVCVACKTTRLAPELGAVWLDVERDVVRGRIPPSEIEID